MIRPNVFHRFMLITAVGIGLLIVGLGSVLSRSLTASLLEQEGRVTADLVRIIAAIDLTEQIVQGALAEEGRSVRAFREHVLRLPEVIRVKVWDAGGRVVWSDESRLIGRHFPDNPELARALAGHVGVSLGLHKPEHEYEQGRVRDARLLEVYIPLPRSSGGSPYGVVEIYKGADGLFRGIDRAQALVWTIAGGGGLVVFGGLAALFWGALRADVRLTGLLEEARRFNAEIVEHIETGIVVVRQDGTVEGWNPAMLRICRLGFTQGQMQGRDVATLCPMWESGPLAAAMREAFDEGTPQALYNLECRPCPTGQAPVLNIRIVPIRGKDGAVARVVVSVDDISAMKALQAQLIHSEKLSTIGEMYAGLTHEINNPLAIIVSKVKTLLAEARERALAPELLRDLEMVDRHASRIAEVVRNLLTFARKATFHWQPTDLNAVLRDTMALVERPFDKLGIRIEPQLDAGLPPIHGDPSLLQQVFMNLLSNAKDAMAAGGTIRLRTARLPLDGGRVRAEVADTGAGMPPAVLERIFEPFFTTKAPGRGTGLGLSVSYGIVRAHGGTLTAQSTVGQGSTFQVTLPIQGGAA